MVWWGGRRYSGSSRASPHILRGGGASWWSRSKAVEPWLLGTIGWMQSFGGGCCWAMYIGKYTLVVDSLG